jgi:hypothetical protein
VIFRPYAKNSPWVKFSQARIITSCSLRVINHQDHCSVDLAYSWGVFKMPQERQLLDDGC